MDEEAHDGAELAPADKVRAARKVWELREQMNAQMAHHRKVRGALGTVSIPPLLSQRWEDAGCAQALQAGSTSKTSCCLLLTLDLRDEYSLCTDTLGCYETDCQCRVQPPADNNPCKSCAGRCMCGML